MAETYVPYNGPVVTRKAARARGLTRFYTGKPCCRDHKAERFVKAGTCIICSSQNKKTPSSREKNRKRAALWRDANPDKVKEQNTTYYENNRKSVLVSSISYHHANKEKCNAKSRAWHEVNREYANACCRSWHATNRAAANMARRLWTVNNPERSKETMRRWYLANKAHVNQKSKEWRLRNLAYAKILSRLWRENNPDKIAQMRRNRRARMQNAEGFHTADDIKKILASQHSKCAYCKMRLKGVFDVDHIKALTNGGSNWPRNLQILCALCNRRKHTKDAMEFAQQEGFLL